MRFLFAVIVSLTLSHMTWESPYNAKCIEQKETFHFKEIIRALAGIRPSFFVSHLGPTQSSIFTSYALNMSEKVTFTQHTSDLMNTHGWKVSLMSLAISFYSMNGVTAQAWTGHAGLVMWLKFDIIWWNATANDCRPSPQSESQQVSAEVAEINPSDMKWHKEHWQREKKD